MELDLIAYSLLSWATLELLFFVVVMLYLVPRMNRLEPPCKYPIPGKQLMYKILETVDWLATQEDADTTFESFLSDWFLGAKCSELKRDNLVELLAYSMYAKHVAALCEAERTDVSELVNVFEKRLGYKIEPGYNEQVDCVQYTLDPVIPFVHRPLALYAVAETVGTVTGLALNLTGFHRRRSPCGNISYWYRQQQHDSFSEVSASQGLGPIVLFHGVGAGLLFCLQTIWKLCCGRTSIVVESPAITTTLSVLWGHKLPSERQLAEGVEGIMNRHGLRTAMFFGHSFGSISVGWIARRKPHLVSQLVLLDPACLLLFLADVARSFLYPDTGGMTFHERLMAYLVIEEMGIACTLGRRNWWYANILWPEDVKCPMVVGVAGKDGIIPVKPIRRYLLSHKKFKTTGSSLPPGADATPVEGLITRSSNCANGPDIGGGGYKVPEHRGGKVVADQDLTPLLGSPATSYGGVATAPVTASPSINSHGEVCSPAPTEWPPRDDGSFCGGSDYGGFAKRVELVYWPDAAHGEVLADQSALDELVRVATRQKQAFTMS